jgi:hypothetical protein
MNRKLVSTDEGLDTTKEIVSARISRQHIPRASATADSAQLSKL